MRRVALAAVLFAVLFATGFVGRASANPRCCTNQKPPQSPPPTGSHAPLPYTGIPLYLPVLLSLGAIGAGVILRSRTRERPSEA